MVGIVAYGAYVPKLRIKAEEIADVWEKEGDRIAKGLGVEEKTVAEYDEDSCTISVEAARNAIRDFKINPNEIGAVYVGSESHPYAVKPTATIVADAAGISPKTTAADFEFACKAGTAALQACFGLVASKMMKYAMAIGADTAQSRPNDALEFTAGSGGAAFIAGDDEKEIIAKLNKTCSYTTDTPDFWRRQHEEFPRHGGRFTGEPAYFKHVLSAAKMIMKDMKTKPEDYAYVTFHQPNGKFPVQAGKMLGFSSKQIEQGLITPFIGNTYSGATMLGLSSILDAAKPGDRVLAVSYGSGAGSDAFDFEITKNIKRAKVPLLEMIKEKKYINYGTYLKHRRKIKSL